MVVLPFEKRRLVTSPMQFGEARRFYDLSFHRRLFSAVDVLVVVLQVRFPSVRRLRLLLGAPRFRSPDLHPPDRWNRRLPYCRPCPDGVDTCRPYNNDCRCLPLQYCHSRSPRRPAVHREDQTTCSPGTSVFRPWKKPALNPRASLQRRSYPGYQQPRPWDMPECRGRNPPIWNRMTFRSITHRWTASRSKRSHW